MSNILNHCYPVCELYTLYGKPFPHLPLCPFEIESISGEKGNENEIYSLFYTYTQPNFPPFVLL